MSIHLTINPFLDDPFEHRNIAKENPTIVTEMMQRLAEYEETMIPPNIGDKTEKGNPKHFNGTFSPGWCQSEPKAFDNWADVAVDTIN